MKGDGTNVMSSEHPSRWRPGVMVLVAVTVFVVIVATAGCIMSLVEARQP